MSWTEEPVKIISHLVPNSFKSALPLNRNSLEHVQRGRAEVQRVLAGPYSDDRLLVIVGPCSIHDTSAALEYAALLSSAARKHRDSLLIAMRVYVEKPRTTIGWKGLVHDPDLRQSSCTSADLTKGLYLSRQIMTQVASTGLPVVTELLSPFAVPFFQDILACGVIGARTTESQTHRELASSLPFPVGFKNGTDGDLTVAIDAMTATASSQTMVSIDGDGRLVHSCSQGNNDAFVILRGGKGGPNYSPEHIFEAEKALDNAGKQARLVVDCSHGNSAKDYRNQGLVVASVVDQVAAGSPILGVMIESNINAGKQHISSAEGIGCLKYGVSITDGCVGWEETEKMLDRLASATLQRRQIAVARSHFSSGISSRFAQAPFLEKGQPIETIEELQSVQ